MKTYQIRWIIGLALLCFCVRVKAQQQPDKQAAKWLENMYSHADLVIEGRVVYKQSQWRESHKTIFSHYTVSLYKISKGNLPDRNHPSFRAEGGETEQMLVRSGTLLPHVGETGLFFLRQVNGQYELIANGFVQYDAVNKIAVNAHGDIWGSLAQLYEALGNRFTYENPESRVPLAAFERHTSTARIEAVEIESFFPKAVEAGTRTRLTINGSGFGDQRGSRGNIWFTRNDNGGASMRELISQIGIIRQPDESEIVSWSDTKIEVLVPSFAGTGRIAVQNDRGEILQSTEALEVTYALTTYKENFFVIDTAGMRTPPDNPLLLNINGAGGYTLFVEPAFFADRQRMGALTRALTTWRCATGMNVQVAAAEGPIDGLSFNGISSLTIGDLPFTDERQSSYYGVQYERCTTGGKRHYWLKEFAIILDKDQKWCFEGTPRPDELDFESEVLRLLGQVNQLEGVNNPADLMYFRLRPGQMKRQLNNLNRTAGARIIHNSLTTRPACTPAVMQRATDANCREVIAAAVAIFSANRTQLCGAGEVQFTNQSRNATSFVWQFPGGQPATSTAPNPVVRYERPGAYSVILSANGPGGENRLERADMIRVAEGSLTVRLGADTSLCPGQRITLDAGVDNATYLWSNGANTRRIEVSRAGRYSVQVTHNGCVASDEIEIQALSNARTMQRNLTLCQGGSVQLGAQGGTSYEWFPAEGLSDAHIANPIAHPSRTTVYRVRIYTNTVCGIVTDSVRVVVNPPPVMPLFPQEDLTICRSGNAFINASVPGENFTYRWSNGSEEPFLITNQPGLYWVEVSAPGGCTVRDSVRVFVTDRIRVTVNATHLRICDGGSVELQASGGAYYSWSPAEGLSNPFAAKTTARPTRTTTYTVRVFGNGSCPADSARVTVEVVPTPTLNLGPENLNVCEESVTLDAGNEGASYVWSDGSTNRRLVINRPGRYWVRVTPRDCNLVLTDTINIRFAPKPAVSLGPDTLRTCRNSFTLDAGNEGMRYLWSDGSTGRRLTVSQNGTYRVTVTDSCGRIATDNIVVRFEKLSQPFEHDSLISCGTNLRLDAGNEGARYLWNNGSTNRYLTVTQTGKYWVAVTDSCQNVLRDSVFVNFPTQSLDIWPDTLRPCQSPLVLDAGPLGTAYRWDDGSTARRLSVTQGGRYTVQVTTPCGNVIEESVVVQFYEGTPDFTFETDRDDPSRINFKARPNNGHRLAYEWDFGDGNRSTQANPVHSYRRMGVYRVKLTIFSLDCQRAAKTVEKEVNIVVASERPTIENPAHWFSLYPNPSATGLLHIRWTTGSTASPRRISITDVNGKVFMQDRPIATGEESTTILLDTLPSGVYMVEIHIGSRKFIHKVVKL